MLVYRKAFTPVDRVTLRAGHAGMQLLRGADVKLRGVIVGDVRGITTDGRRRASTLALDPDQVGLIPADVSARLLPKTLFGERYVELVLPADRRRRPSAAGAVIGQDRTPRRSSWSGCSTRRCRCCRAIEPDKLAATLGALATALEGRGDQLGANLVALDGYLGELNEEMPTIAEDVRRLARCSTSTTARCPTCSPCCATSAVSSTVIDQRDQLASSRRHHPARRPTRGFLTGTRTGSSSSAR